MNWNRVRRNDQTRQAAKELRETERLEREVQRRAFPLLSAAEIVRRLAWIKASDKTERYARRHPGLNTVSRMTGYGRDYLYKLINGRIPTRNAQIKLSAALQEMDLPNLYQPD